MKKILLFGVMLFFLTFPIAFANSPPKLMKENVGPPVAAPNTIIVYQVTYIDEDGDAPEYVRVIFDGIGAKEMRKISGNYRTGAVYEFSWKQDDGFAYRFEASDRTETAKLPWYGGTLAPVNIVSEKLESNKIYFFSRKSNEPLWSYDLGKNQVQNAVISDDGSYIAVKTNDYIYFFSRESSAPLWKYQCESGAEDPSGGAGWVDISADGKYIAGGCRGSLNLFSKNGQLVWTYKDDISIHAVSISADGEYLALGTSSSEELIFFSKKSNKPLWKYQATSDVHGLSISSDGNLVAAGSHSPEEIAYLFSKESNVPLTKYKTSQDSPVWTATMSRDGKYSVYGLDSADTYNSIFLFSNDKNTPLKTWTTDWWARSVDISSNGKYIVAGSGDHNVYLIDRDKDEPLWKFEADERVGSVSISQDGNYIAAGSKDKKVYLLSKESKIPLWDYKTDSWVDSVAISADGSYIVAGTGAANYMSEGHHPIYNPEKGLKEEIPKTAKGADAIIKETICGDGMCEGTESYDSCPKDCCGENCNTGKDIIEKNGKLQDNKEATKPIEKEIKEKGFFERMINFFRGLFG